MNSNSVASTKNFELRAPSSMSEEEILALIDDTPFAVLSTSDAEGVPYGVPVTTLRMGRSIYFHGSRARMSRKLVNLSLKPFASLCWVGENQIVENYCAGVYLSPKQVTQLLKDMEQDPKVLEDLEEVWSGGQLAVLKKALSAAAELGVGLLEATEVVEPNPIRPNESTSYSNLYHCDRDGVYLYIDAVYQQLADAIGESEGQA